LYALVTWNLSNKFLSSKGNTLHESGVQQDKENIASSTACEGVIHQWKRIEQRKAEKK